MPIGILRRPSWGPMGPPAGTPIDWGNPIASGLIRSWTFNESGGRTLHDGAQGYHSRLITASVDPAWRSTLRGPGIAFSDTSSYAQPSGPAVLVPHLSIEVIVRFDATPAAPGDYYVMGFSDGYGSGTHDKAIVLQQDGTPGFYAYDGSGKTALGTAGSALAVGETAHLIATADGATFRIHKNGKQVGSTAGGDTYTGYSQANIFLGAPGSTQAPASTLALVRVWRRALLPTEVAALYVDPWQLYAPPVWRRYVVPGAGVQILSPVADVSAGAWTTDTGAATNLYAAIDEATANDADYVRSSLSPVTADESKFRLAPATDPAVGTGHILRYRYLKDATSGDRIDLVVTLYRADGVTAVASQTHTDIDAVTTATLTLSTVEADSIPSADYSVGLVVGFSAVKV